MLILQAGLILLPAPRDRSVLPTITCGGEHVLDSVCNSVVDPYPDWIQIQLGPWIRIRIWIHNPDLGLGGQN
jgi:hypothetical protein